MKSRGSSPSRPRQARTRCISWLVSARAAVVRAHPPVLVRIPFLFRSAIIAPPQQVQRLVADHVDHPGHRPSALRVIAFGMAPDLHIGLLQCLLRPGLTPQDTQGYTKEFRGGCFVEAGESGLVAKAAARQELAQVMGRIGGYVARRRRLHGSTRLAVPVGPVPGRGGLTALADRQDGRDKFMAQTWGHGSAEAGGCPATGWPWEWRLDGGNLAFSGRVWPAPIRVTGRGHSEENKLNPEPVAVPSIAYRL